MGEAVRIVKARADAIELQANPMRHIRRNKDFLMLFVGINLYEKVRSILTLSDRTLRTDYY